MPDLDSMGDGDGGMTDASLKRSAVATPVVNKEQAESSLEFWFNTECLKYCHS